jgi:hypothetical protein
MTCIVGVEHADGVVIGGDSMGTSDWRKETGEFYFSARIIDRRPATDGALIGQQDAPTLNTAIAYARGAVTVFMEGTQA